MNNKKRKTVSILLIAVSIFLLFSNLIYAENNFNFDKWILNGQNYKLFNYFKDRLIEGNHWYIKFRPELDSSDNLTETQASNRTRWIFEYAYKLNHMYPEVHPRRIAKDFYAIIEFETHGVNYFNMDDGQSFGITALTWSTAQSQLDKLDLNFNIARKTNTTGNLNYDSKYKLYYSEYDRNFLRANPKLQIMCGISYYYTLLSRYYDGNRLLALTGYNIGPGLNSDSPRFRNYYFNIRGRLDYYEEEFSKLK